MGMIKKKILEAENYFRVTFTKKDGSERIMNCSKVELEKDFQRKRVIEETKKDNTGKEKVKRKIPEGNLFVMEVLEKDGGVRTYQNRSVKIESIKKLEILNSEFQVIEDCIIPKIIT